MARPRTSVRTSCRRASLSLGMGLLLAVPAGAAVAAPEQPSPEQQTSEQVTLQSQTSEPVEDDQLSPSPAEGAGTSITATPSDPEDDETGGVADPESPSVAPSESAPSFDLECPMHNSILQPGETVSITVQATGDVTEPLSLTADSPVVGGDVQIQGTTAVYRAPSPYTSNQDSFTLRATDAAGTTSKCQVRVTLEQGPTETPTPSPTPTSSPSDPTPTQTQTATQTVTAPAPSPTVTTRTPWFPGDNDAGEEGPFAPQPPPQNDGDGDDGAAPPGDAEEPTETATVSVTSVPSGPEQEDTSDEQDTDAQPDASDAEAAGQQDPTRLAAPGWLLPAGLIAIVLLLAAGLLAWMNRNRGGGNHR